MPGCTEANAIVSLVPEAAEFAGVENGVVAEEGKIFGLGDEHAVEGIFRGPGRSPARVA